MQNTQKPQTPSTAGECMIISEKQFLRDHTLYSAMSSWLFAIAGATNIGVLCAFSAKILTAVEQNQPLSKVMGNKKYNLIAMEMIAFGGVCMAVSNWLESKKVVTEWQLGAGKLQRKANIVEKEQEQAAPAEVPAHSKNWAASVRPKTPDNVEPLANYFRPG